VVQKAIRAIRKTTPDMLIMADTCLCEYTSHGHCGVVREGEVLNDESLELLARTALSQAEAGADMVAPSAMMDGQVGAIRETLDDARLENIAIMAYAVKYASAFYGPFREAAIARRLLAIVAPTRWIHQMRERRCVKRISTTLRVLTS
jgi:porphobilinogen synthase